MSCLSVCFARAPTEKLLFLGEFAVQIKNVRHIVITAFNLLKAMLCVWASSRISHVCSIMLPLHIAHVSLHADICFRKIFIHIIVINLLYLSLTLLRISQVQIMKTKRRRKLQNLYCRRKKLFNKWQYASKLILN